MGRKVKRILGMAPLNLIGAFGVRSVPPEATRGTADLCRGLRTDPPHRSALADIEHMASLCGECSLGCCQTRCLIPWFDGAILSQEWTEALWDKFVTGAPRPRMPPGVVPLAVDRHEHLVEMPAPTADFIPATRRCLISAAKRGRTRCDQCRTVR